MIYLKTKLYVFDNTGILLVRCIHVPEVRKGCATLGTLVVVIPKKKQLKKAEEKIDLSLKSKVFLGIICGVKKKIRRKAGYLISFEKNSVILLTKDYNLIARRIVGPVCHEVLKYHFMHEISALKKTI